MSNTVEKKLAQLGIELPQPAVPAANYVPFVVSGGHVYISGQLPVEQGVLRYKGVVGVDLSVEQGQQAARLVAINILAQLKSAVGGDWQRVVRCVRLAGLVNCPAGFTEQPKVINGASDLMVEVLGDRGRHARLAVGTNALPFNAAVEIEALFELR